MEGAFYLDFPVLFRRRFIPDELIKLEKDEIIYFDKRVIVTKWEVLKPRGDFSHGISWYLLEDGFKISKFFKATGELHYIYCDIIEHFYNSRDNSYLFNDLLADVIIYNDGFVKVMDVGELSQALAEGLISVNQLTDALDKLDKLLQIIYDNKLDKLMADLESCI